MIPFPRSTICITLLFIAHKSLTGLGRELREYSTSHCYHISPVSQFHSRANSNININTINMSPKALLTSVASFDPNEGLLLDVSAIDKDSMRWRNILSKLTHGVPTDPLEMNVEVNMLRHAWSNEEGVINELPLLSPPTSSRRKSNKQNSRDEILVNHSHVSTSPIVVDTRAVGRRNTRPKKKAQQTKHKQQLNGKWQLQAETGYNRTPTKNSIVGSETNSTLNTPSTKMSPSTKKFATSFFSNEVFESSGQDRVNVFSDHANVRHSTPLPMEHALSSRSQHATFDRSFFEWLAN